MKRVQLPDGSIGEFPDDMDDDAIAGVLRKQFPPKSAAAPNPAEAPDPAEDMPFYEKFRTGLGGGMRNVYLGAKNLIGQGTPEEAEERKFWNKSKEHLGGWGTAGEITGEIAATAPVGGLVGSGAKLLTKALPAAARLGSVGGRVANLGAVGRAATEGALSAGIVGDASDNGIGDRLDNFAMGGAVGSILPTTMLGGAVARKFGGSFSTAPEKAAARAGRALEKTLGKQQFDDVTRSIGTATPTRLPQTTASLVDSPRVGALERGARARELVDFTPHDTQVSKQVWNSILDDTVEAAKVDHLSGRPDKIINTGKAMFRSLPFDDASKNDIYEKLLPILDSDELRANPLLRRKLTQATQSILDPEATSEILPQLYWSLKELGEGSTAASSLRRVIQESADELSGGLMSRMHGAYGKAMDKLGQAQGAQNVRKAFEPVAGIPTTPQVLGGPSTNGALVPRVKASALRKTLAKEAGRLEPQALDDLKETAEELRRYEIFKPISDTGGSTVDIGSLRGTAVSLANVTPMWRAKGPLSVLYGRADKATQQAVDEALLNPQKFIEVAAAKQRAGAPLSKWEQRLAEMVQSQARVAGTNTGE